MASIEPGKSIRSRSCTINPTKKLSNILDSTNKLYEIYNNCDEDKLTLPYSSKEIVEKNLKRAVTLSEEIGKGKDDEKFATHLDKSMNIEVKINHKLAILIEFITIKNWPLPHIYLTFRGLVQLQRQILVM